MRNIITLCLIVNAVVSAQSLSGGSGLLRLPTALLNDDAVAVIGSSFLPAETLPYTNYQRDVQMYSASLTFLPFFEVSLRLSHQLGLKKSVNHTADRMASCKLRLLPEGRYSPAVLIGINDLSSTVENNKARHFAASYLVLSKTIAANGLQLEPTIGYAHKLFSANHYDFIGWFGGVEIYHEQFPFICYLLEVEQERVNTGIRAFVFNHLYLCIAWMELEHVSYNLSFAFNLNKLTQLY